MPENAYQELAEQLVSEYYKTQSAELLANLEKRNLEELSLTKEKILGDIRLKLSDYEDEDGRPISEEEKDKVITLVKNDLWGYGILDSLIADKDISDIKLYRAGNIRKKAEGRRGEVAISFADENAYRAYVTRLLERNKVNLGAANAIQTFTDSNQDDFILRITVISELLTDSGLPVVAIRKIPKDKLTLRDLEKRGMFNHCYAGYSEDEPDEMLSDENDDFRQLVEPMISSKGILFTGKGASGKTTLMNAMIAKIPSNESVMLCQENAELFDDCHPDLFSCHVLNNSGDSKISYDLGALTRAALLMDLDRIIVGEVKEGGEVAGLSKASMTGHKCWASVHGESCELALDKMADYISQELGYSTNESLKQLQGFEYVVHLRHFRVDEVIRIMGWDNENEKLILHKVYPVPHGARVSAETMEREKEPLLAGEPASTNDQPRKEAIYGLLC